MNHELHDALKYLSQLLLRRPLLHAIYNQLTDWRIRYFVQKRSKC